MSLSPTSALVDGVKMGLFSFSYLFSLSSVISPLIILFSLYVSHADPAKCPLTIASIGTTFVFVTTIHLSSSFEDRSRGVSHK